MRKLNLIIAVCILVFSSCQKKPSTKLNVAVAANMQFAMEELSEAFNKKSGIECELIISSSGKLTAQIMEKAPYDIFISADMKFPTELFNKGFTTQKPEIYAYGKLVMWSMVEGLNPTFEILKEESIKHIALANPKMAPYGVAAIEVLEHYNLADSLNTKFVFGESISQTNQFIISQAAQVGFTTKSVVLSPQMKGKGHWIDINEAYYTPIAQGIVVIKHENTDLDKAQKFYKFLFSAEAKEILENYGYKVGQK